MILLLKALKRGCRSRRASLVEGGEGHHPVLAWPGEIVDAARGLARSIMVSPPQTPWSPTAHAFAQHQFSHVTNFWKQGRQALFHLEALPDGCAKLNLTFQLPSASEMVPPPSYVPPSPSTQRPILPLFPKGFFPQGPAPALKPKQASQNKISSKRRKSYWRSVLHQAALAAPSLPPPKNGSLRQAASACIQRLEVASGLPKNPQSARKRPCSDPPVAPSPLAQRIRADIHIEESEAESPEKEILRSSPCPTNSSSPISPCLKSLPSPVPLDFTPPPPERSRLSSCVNCDDEMTPDHQCVATDSDSNWEDIEIEQDLYPTLDVNSEDWAEQFTHSIQTFHGISP